MNYSTKFTESVLDYWFAIEFLSQDNYPNVFEIQNIAKKHKREISEGKHRNIYSTYRGRF